MFQLSNQEHDKEMYMEEEQEWKETFVGVKPRDGT
jgi:hypothetical protein